MENIKAFLTSRTPITDTIDVPNWLFVALLIVLVLLVIIIISAAKNLKNEKTKSKCFTENNDIIPFLDEEKPSVVETIDANEQESPTLPAKNAKLQKEALASDSVALADEVVTTKNDVTDKKAADEIKKKASIAKEIEAMEEAAAVESTVETVVAVAPTKEEAKAETETKVDGKFEVCNSDIGGFRYILKANNGQLLYESRDYKTVRSCSDAIDKFKNAVSNGAFVVKADKFDRYKFTLKSPTSNNLIYVGESFATKAACLSNIESVKRFAVSSPVNDITKEDFVAKGKAYVIPEDVKLSVTNPNGTVGKWEVAKNEDGDKPTFSFLLYASNGQLLYESRDYASAASCKNGVETFIKTVKEGEFIIDPDKAGRFKFILRNKNNNSLMEYIGPNYTTNKAASNSADSVYKFALVTPTDSL